MAILTFLLKIILEASISLLQTALMVHVSKPNISLTNFKVSTSLICVWKFGIFQDSAHVVLNDLTVADFQMTYLEMIMKCLKNPIEQNTE